MEKLVENIEHHKNLIQSTSGTIASIGLEKAGQKVGGVLVTPAVWVLNYSVDGSAPDKMDAAIYATAFISAGASIVTGALKAVIDDDLNKKIMEAQKKEDGKFSPFIKACYRYAATPPAVNAMTIANKGGTAWRHPNGVWLYITDANGHLVSDFQPNIYVEILRPKTPLRKKKSGVFDWEVIRKK